MVDVVPLEVSHLPALERLVIVHVQDDQVAADIGWLLFEPDRPAAGMLLLETGLARIGDDLEGIEAFELAHGLGWGGGIPTAWQHIDQVITRSRFAWHDTSYLMWGEGTSEFGGSVNQEVRVEFETLTPCPSGVPWQPHAPACRERDRSLRGHANCGDYAAAVMGCC